MKILILNGPNLNLLGTREPEIYGTHSLKHIEKAAMDFAEKNKQTVDMRQSNDENELLKWIQHAKADGFDSIVINPAALGHTSVALRDALANFNGPKVEVHLTNTYKREIFRKNKLISPVCDGVIEGFGAKVYLLALQSLV